MAIAPVGHFRLTNIRQDRAANDQIKHMYA